MAKNCKYYISGGEDGTKRTTKKSWLRLAKCYNGLGLLVYTNKKGVV
jgi:hypothetical protein